jgi:hypothetical protein
MSFHLHIQSNSPGELTSWVGPIVAEFKTQCPDSNVTIHLVPCQYKTGQEAQIAAKLPGVTAVTTPSETIKAIFNIKSSPREKGAILYLGGDPMYSKLLGYKFKVPSYAYTEHRYKIGTHFKHIFRKHDDGDLMAVRPHQFSTPRETILKKYDLADQQYLLVFPGSRPQHFEHIMPLLAGALDTLHKTHPDIHPIIQISPFITDELLAKVKNKHSIPSARWLRGDSLDLISISKLLVTIPGTNNAEAMYMKCPMLILVPTHHPKHLILDGLPGLIGNLPVLGPPLKNIALKHYHKKHPLLSLPNRYFKKMVVPEFIGSWTPAELSEKISNLWNSPQSLSAQVSQFSKIELDKEITILQKICTTILKKA